MQNYITLSDSARLTGKHKSSIHRAIKDGRLNARMVDGVYSIAESDLFEVFPRIGETLRDDANATGSATHETINATAFTEELATLRAENKGLVARLDDMKEQVDYLRGELKRQTTISARLIENHPQQPTVESVFDEPAPTPAVASTGNRRLMVLVVLLVMVAVGAVMALRMGLII